MECDVPLPKDDFLPPLSTSSVDNEPIYEESHRTLSSPALTTQRQLTYQASNEEPTQPSSMEITAFILDTNHRPQTLSPEQEISDILTINEHLDTQGEPCTEKV
ncbi:hypothetical protein OnM2_051077 [Erysiphe neolycopersici]|uniref:Uncharacterized protein n=1 Tax=Erysiphe neolycopersici TaxID=212602 RepID=A0A420HSI0_9PEZI|nr:hypothetical protein OnM2_051077 [Erysiphe neolycopersici]